MEPIYSQVGKKWKKTNVFYGVWFFAVDKVTPIIMGATAKQTRIPCIPPIYRCKMILCSYGRTSSKPHSKYVFFSNIRVTNFHQRGFASQTRNVFFFQGWEFYCFFLIKIVWYLIFSAFWIRLNFNSGHDFIRSKYKWFIW